MLLTERLAIKVIMISTCYIEKTINQIFEKVRELSIKLVYDATFEIYDIIPSKSLLCISFYIHILIKIPQYFNRLLYI